jgi:HEAT repeat protein/tRNA A-37 threonylcarbamoyl transferase component Bud32
MAWQEGQLIKEGKYEIKKKLGQGGYGTVYLANDRSGRHVAIKTLHEHLRENEDYERFEQDFMNEARRLAEFSHLPFIVSIYEVIKEGDTWGIVMEYVDGKNLDLLGIISEELALLYIRQISSALSEVHEKGLLHRDIKPSNILVRNETNEAILVDFGIAREFTAKIIQTQTPLWTPFYASPEQYNERTERSASSDIYSLAATLYKILTGKEPEAAPSRMCGCELKSPKQLNTNISDVVEAGILQGLELQADNRPQSIKEWLEVMELKIITPSEYEISRNRLSIHKTEESIAIEEQKYRIERRVQSYIADLSAPEKYFREVAIRELRALGKYAYSAVPYLIKIMENPDDIFFSGIENVLRDIGASSVSPLSRLLGHENLEIRRKAAKALAEIGIDSSTAIPEIILATEDSDDKVIWYAIVAIGIIGVPAKDAIPVLIQRLSDANAGIRAYAAWALGRMGVYAKIAIPEIVQMFRNEKTEEKVLLAALESLEVLGYDINKFCFKQNNGRRRLAKAYIAIKRRKLGKVFNGHFLPRPLSANIPPQTR